MIYNSIMNMIGNTPLLKYQCTETPGANIYIKMESMNPTGSIKDRACLMNISSALEDGSLTKDKIILDSSSGNMACSLAFYGKSLGYKVKVICNTKLTEDKKQFIKFFGAQLEIDGDITYEGNRKCYEMANTQDGKLKFCFMDQLHNPSNPIAYYRTLGPEILNDIPDVKAIVGSMGSGGTMCGIARYFQEYHPTVNLFTSQAASGTKIPGTGSFIDGDYKTPFIQELMINKLLKDTFLISTHQAEKRTKELSYQGIFVGLQAGGVLETAITAVNKYGIKGNVVCIIGDSGWKNMEKLQLLGNCGS